jgi:hypothetical protein
MQQVTAVSAEGVFWDIGSAWILPTKESEVALQKHTKN